MPERIITTMQLNQAGLKHVGTSTQLIPVGTWGGQLSTMGLTAIQAIVETMKLWCYNKRRLLQRNLNIWSQR